MASPLLANLYMRRFVLGWKVLGHAARLNARIVNYADDFVICCRGRADKAMAAMRTMMEKLRLTVNEKKTRRCGLPADTFHVSGVHIRAALLTSQRPGLHQPRTGGESRFASCAEP